LTGLDGSNLLAYLAALGTLRVLTMAERDSSPRMSWVDPGCWTPVLHDARITSPNEVVELLATRVCPTDEQQDSGAAKSKKRNSTEESGEALILALRNANRAFLTDCLDLHLNEFHSLLVRESQDPNRDTADFLTALGSDCF